MREVDAKDPFGNCPAWRTEDVMDFPASGCREGGHIQCALAKADHCDAFVVKYIQRAHLTFGDDRASKLLLPGEPRLVFAIRVLTDRDHYVGEILRVLSIHILILDCPTSSVLFQGEDLMV